MNNLSDLTKQSTMYNQGDALPASVIQTLASNPANLFQIGSPSGPNATIGSIALNNIMSTGIVSGGSIAANGTNAVDISQCVARAIDNTTPGAPTFIEATVAAKTAQVLTGIASNPFTILSYDSAGNLVQTYDWTNENLFRSNALLGVVIHISGQIEAIQQRTNPSVDTPLRLLELYNGIGPINQSGNVFSANGANLNLNKSAGNVIIPGYNYKVSPAAPDSLTQGALTALTFKYCYRNGSGGITISAGTTNIVPGQYDNGSGTLAAVSSVSYTVQRIYLEPATNIVYIMYGQRVYSSISDAILNSSIESITNYFGNNVLLFRGYLVLRGNATDLTNVAQACFIEAPKLGYQGGGTGTTATTIFNDGLPKWTFSTSTGDADPGAGNFRLNNGTAAAATFIYINNANNDGATFTNVIQSLIKDSVLYIKTYNSNTRYLVYKVTGNVTVASGYLKIPISFISGGGSSIVSGDSVEFNFYATVPSSLINVGGVVILETTPGATCDSSSEVFNNAGWMTFKTGAGYFQVSNFTILGIQNGSGTTNFDIGIYEWNNGNSGDPAINKLVNQKAAVNYGTIGNTGETVQAISSPLLLSPNTRYFASVTADNTNVGLFGKFGGLASAKNLTFQIASVGANLPASVAAASRANSGRCFYIAMT